MGRSLFLAVLVLGVSGCKTTSVDGASGPRSALRRSSPQTEDALAKIAARWWSMLLERSPQYATYLGIRQHDQELPDESAHGRKLFFARVRELRRAVAALPELQLSEASSISREVLLWSMDKRLALRVCRRPLWSVDQLDGPQVWLAELPRWHRIRSTADVDTLVARYNKVPAFLQTRRDNLKRGADIGWVAPRIAVMRVVGQLDRLLQAEAANSPFVRLAKFPAAWTAQQQQVQRQRLIDAVKTQVLPAFAKHKEFLGRFYLTQARDVVGVRSKPDGRACYHAQIRVVTGTDWAPEKLHKIGLDELDRLRQQMMEIARLEGATGDLKQFFATLRARKDMYVAEPDALVAAAQRALDRAQSALKRTFGRLPKTAITVKAMDAYRAQDAPAAYYFEAPEDGSRPAIYYLNTNKLDARPLYNLEALTFHEAVPGHHLQIALAREQPAIPQFRRHEAQTAFVEGWALYAEVLSDELKLYSSNLSRFGYLNYQGWRAARLVVDTGLHTLGWTRKQAIDFMLENTALSEEEAINEVDRYIIWPGQALAYLVGRLRFQALRKKAQDALGPRFSLSAFHDEVLRHGAVPMDLAERLIDNWIAAQASKEPQKGQ
ncbi:MAG: DUF885 domain-containing protein [Deltaproteobacteria bacterium]|nr:DUF885 domain-containing protein [Deltaproteobacteria bacterium]